MGLTLDITSRILIWAAMCKKKIGCKKCGNAEDCKDALKWVTEQYQTLNDEERQKVSDKPQPTPDSLNNFKACLIPTRFAKRDCPGCHQYRGCVFLGKGHYARYRL